MTIRGKPGRLYRYSAAGGRVPLSEHVQSRREVRQAAWTEVDVPGWMRRDEETRQRRKAAANLDALQRPLKPPSKRAES